MILALSVYSKAPKSDDCSRLTNFRHKLYCIDICRDLIRRSYIFLDNPNANGQMDEVNSESILRSMLFLSTSSSDLHTEGLPKLHPHRMVLLL